MALVKNDNGTVELRDDLTDNLIRTFENVTVCDENHNKGRILLLRKDSGYVELYNSRNGNLMFVINDEIYIDASFEGDQIRLVNSRYDAEMRNIDDGKLVSSESIGTKPVRASLF